jgi:hypothetical protein
MTTLAQRLLALGYTELFQRLDDEALAALWSEKGAPDALRKIALDVDEDVRARFLAAEAVLSRRTDAFDDIERREVAGVYATALRGQFTGSANEWSFPGQPLGRAGEHVLALGDSAMPALTGLLDDDTPVIYEGSKEAMVGASYGYRVKDLAAQFIAGITGLPFVETLDPAARDAMIAEQKHRLR